MHTYYQYLSTGGADIFTMICLPEKSGKFPTAIHRTPYADYAEKMSEEEVCERVLNTQVTYIVLK